jgi:signal transduction histidine kinase
MADDAIAAGARGYLQKGIGAEELCERVWEASGRQRPELPLDDVFALPTEPEPAAVAGRDVAARAVEASPTGVAVLGVTPGEPVAGWVLAYLNPEARTLLGVPDNRVGERLGDLVPGLGRALDELLGGVPGEEAQLRTDAGALRVRARRVDDEVVVSLDPRPADGGSEDAERAVERLRAAIARTAHELRTPVTVLVGLSDAVQSAAGRLTDTQRGDMRAALRRQADVLERITSDLETATQVQRGALAVEVEPIDVEAVVRSCLTAGPHEDPVQVYVDGVVTALADPARLTQIVTNLLSNARKYAEPPYEVHLTRDGDQVHLTVADRGDGVPEDFRPLLFEEFTRAGADARGTGLGLFVVRSLAEALGGAVDYRPRHGGGSLFTVRLPAT